MSVGNKIKSLFWTEADPSAQRPATAPSPAAAPAARTAAPVPAARTATQAPQTAAAAAATPDLAGIAANVEQRLAALDAAITAEDKRVRERRDARAQALTTATAKVNAEIKQLEDRVAHLRTQLAAATAEVQTQDTTDQQQHAAFVERSRAEAVRLAAVRDFIARGGSQ